MADPVTRAEVETIVGTAVEASKLDMLQRIDDSRLDMLRRMDDGRIEMLERIEKTETTLLREFRKWAVRMEASRRVHEASMLGFTERLQSLEERMDELDSRGL